MKRIDLVGKFFGRWEVIAPAQRTYQTMWECVCVCGAKKVVSGANLTSGHSTSCGCWRDENRPNLWKKRNFNGVNNPRAKKNIAKYGANYVPSSSVWYKRAAGIFHSALKNKIPVGFNNAVEFAAYVKSIAPERCPVFGVKFIPKGSGFSKWSPSIDKIDPKKGYVVGNVQVISVLANCMKRDASKKELVAFANWVLSGEKE